MRISRRSHWGWVGSHAGPAATNTQLLRLAYTQSTQARTTIHTVKRRGCKRALRMGKLYDQAMHLPLTIYWEGSIEKATAIHGNVEERVRQKVNRVSNETDLTVGTHTGASCIKPRPPNRVWVKYKKRASCVVCWDLRFSWILQRFIIWSLQTPPEVLEVIVYRQEEACVL